MTAERVTVLGIGNPLVRDEGVGVRVIEEVMASFEFPPNVTLMDAGTMGMSMLGILQAADFVLVVDAVDGTGHPPGTVVRMDADDLAGNQVLHSLHDIRFTDVLEAVRLTGAEPASHFIGIQVKDMGAIEIGLTPEVEAAVPDAVAAVLAVLLERGIEASPRQDATPDARVLEALRRFTPMPGGPEGLS